jgi:hypothetical protein
VREAVGVLDICAAIGVVTKELVNGVMDDDLEDVSLKIFSRMAAKDQQGAVKHIDETCKTESPMRLIEAMFATYAKCVYRPETEVQQTVRNVFPNICEMTQIFLKWTAPQQLSADVVPLLVLELMSVGETRLIGRSSQATYARTPVLTGPSTTVESASRFAELTGAKSIR